MLFCMQEAILYVRGRDPVCPGYRPRWWPDDPSSSPQNRSPLVGSWFEGRRVGAASLLPWQMRRNLFGVAVGGGGGGGGAGTEDSRVRADGMRVPPMFVLPLDALRLRWPFLLLLLLLCVLIYEKYSYSIVLVVKFSTSSPPLLNIWYDF